MKRFFALLLALCMIFALAACGQKEAPAEEPKAEPAAPAEEQPTPAAEPVKLVVGLVQASSHNFVGYMEKFAESVSEATDGTVTVEIFADSQLGGEADVTAALTEGTIDMCINATGELAKRVPAYGICDAPFVYKSAEHMNKVVNSDLFQEYHDELLANYGIRVLGSFYVGTRHITSNKPINTPEDLVGLKIRVPDQEPSMNAFKIFDAAPTGLAYAELYMALQQGVVDAEENSYGIIISGKLYEVQKYLALTGHQIQNNFLTISEKTFQKLSPEQQEAVLECAAKVCEEGTADMIYQEENVQRGELEDKIEIVEVDQAAFRDVAMANMEANGYFDLDMYQKIQEIG